MFVCICHAVRESDLVEAVQEGTVTFQDLRLALGCGRSCGHCKRHINVVIEATLQASDGVDRPVSDQAEATIDAAIEAELQAEFDGTAAPLAPCERDCAACPATSLNGSQLVTDQPIVVPRWRSQPLPPVAANIPVKRICRAKTPDRQRG